VLSGVGCEPTGVDVISERSGLETRRTRSGLALLELKGYVTVTRAPRCGAFVRRAAL